jgi:hypothetical protein
LGKQGSTACDALGSDSVAACGMDEVTMKTPYSFYLDSFYLVSGNSSELDRKASILGAVNSTKIDARQSLHRMVLQLACLALLLCADEQMFLIHQGKIRSFS